MSERNLDFDSIVDRKGTNCLKYDFAKRRGYPEDVLPLWVADMDFRTSSYVEDAVISLAKHGIYGYTNTDTSFFQSIAGWMKRHHDWEVKEEWHVKTPGVVFAMANAVRAVTAEGDFVLIQEPVYYPFKSVIRQNHREWVSSDLVYDGEGTYSVDYDDFEKKIIDNKVKLFILCNPHNPVGRVWTKEELSRLGAICKKHGVTVFSDEIHEDFIWRGSFNVFQEVEEDFKEFTITATAPSKTFNLAGLQQSNIFIPNTQIRKAFIREYERTGMDEPNTAGVVAAKAAYSMGEEWYEGMKAYVRANIDYAIEFVNNRLPGVKAIDPEGTYLLWLDFNGLGMSEEELEKLMVYKAGLWLDAGAIFGEVGKGFERINTACPRSILTEALERIERAIS